MGYVSCPKCGSPEHCETCGATLVRPCYGRIAFRYRGPNIVCRCGHSWRVTGAELTSVHNALDICQKICKDKYK
jgi:hypothetical protein